MDATEMIEVEILGAEIQRLKLENQQLLKEKEGLRSTVSEVEKANDDLREELGRLRLEKEKMETKFGKILLDRSLRRQELKDELDQAVHDRATLQEEVDLKTEEIEKLFLEIQALERTNQEDLSELRQAQSDRMRLMEEKNGWEERTDKITEDNTVIILTLLASQDELEDQLNRKTAVLDAFSARVTELVKNTRRIIEGGHDENVNFSGGGEDDGGLIVGWSRSYYGDDETSNVMQVMTWPLEEELKAIEAAAFGRRSSPVAETDGCGVGNSEVSEW